MQMKSMRKQFVSYLELLAAQLCVAISITTAKSIASDIPAQLLIGYRFFLASVLVSSYVVIFNKNLAFKEIKALSFKDILKIAVQAACAGYLFSFFLLWGLEYTSATRAGIISSFTPACIVILSIIILKDRLKFKQIISLVIAIIGLLLISYKPELQFMSSSLLGDLLVLASVVPESLFTILAKLYPVKISATAKTLLVHVVNFVLVLPASIYAYNYFDFTMPVNLYLPIFIFTITSVLFYVFWYRGLRTISGSNAGLCTTFMPITTAILANIFLHEYITCLEIMGIVLAIFSIVLTIV